MATSSLKGFVTKAYQILRLGVPGASNTNSIADPVFNVDKLGSTDLKSLTDCMHLLNADNVNLHEMVPKRSLQPVTFIDVCQNSIMNIVLIVIRPGQGIPLHDHPGMLGIIKVLHGQVKITSYSPVPGETSSNGKLPVLRMPDVIMSSLSYPQVLTPNSKNIHQIEYVSGEGEHDYAAFLDVLSPPYDDEVGCNYYKSDEPDRHKSPVDENNPSRCNLTETKCPRDYQTESVFLQ